MSILRANRSARPRARKRRIGFRQAVPAWRDRRELRRIFRRAARAALAERKTEMTALLERLAADHVPLSEIAPGPRPRDGIVEFLDGTRLLLATRRGSRTNSADPGRAMLVSARGRAHYRHEPP